MLLELPTRNDLPAFNYLITLEGQQYQLDFTYNDRMGKWMISISDTSGNVLVGEVPAVLNINLFGRYGVVGLPPGKMYFYDTSTQNTDPARNDLGERVVLLYDESVA